MKHSASYNGIVLIHAGINVWAIRLEWVVVVHGKLSYRLPFRPPLTIKPRSGEQGLAGIAAKYVSLHPVVRKGASFPILYAPQLFA